MSTSIGDLKNSGLQGNNWPWQYKVLLGLDKILAAIGANKTEYEAQIIKATCPGPTPASGYYLEVRVYNTSTGSFGAPTYYSPGSTTPVNLSTCTKEYANDSLVLTQIYNELVDQGVTLDAIETAVEGTLTVQATDLDIRTLTCDDTVSLCFDNAGTPTQVSDTNPLPVNAVVTVPTPLPVSQDPTSDPWTVDATDLDIRDLDFTTDSVDVSGSNVNAVVTATDLDIRDLDFTTDSVDVTGSDVTVSNTVTVQATALDVRALTCTDEVSLCANGTTVNSGNPLPVDAGALTPSADGVGMYGSTDGGTNWTAVQVDSNGVVSTNTTIVGPLGNQLCADSVAVSLCTDQAQNLADIKTAVEGTLDVNVLTIPEVEIKNDAGNPIPVLQQYPGTVPYASCEVATGTGTTPVVFSAGATSMSVQNLGNDNITVDTDASSGVILPPGVSITWDAPVGQRFDTFTFTGSSVSSLFIVTAVIAS